MHLHSRRVASGDDADFGFDPLALEGDARDVAPDEGPALFPFAADFPPSLLAESGSDVDEPHDARVLVRVRDLEGLGRRLDAIMVLRQSLGEEPGNVRLRLRLAELLEANGEEDTALEELETGLRTRADAALQVQRGALLGRMGRHAEAEQELRAAIAVSPDSVDAALHLGLSLLRRGRHADALRELERAQSLAPRRGDVSFHLGEAWYHSGQLDRALQNLLRASELAPEDPRAYKLLGRLLDRMGRTEEAMVMHRKAREAGH
jgi:Flp pilus assembly protein TadD